MALIKSKISIPFSQGLQTKTDDLQNQFSGLRELENVLFDNPNKLIKRKGYSLLQQFTLDNLPIADSKFLTSFKDELGVFTSDNYYSYSESIDKWIARGKVFSALPTSTELVRNTRQQSDVNAVHVEGLTCYVYKDSTGVRTCILDNSTNTFLLTDTLVNATGNLCKVAKIQNEIYIFYTVSNEIKYKTLNMLSPSVISSETSIVSDLNTTDTHYDVISVDNKIVVVYNSSDSSGVLKTFSIQDGGVLSSVLTATGEVPSECLSVNTDDNFNILITYSDGTDIKCLVYSFTFGVEVIPATSIETVSDVVNATMAKKSNGLYDVYYEIAATSVKNHKIRKNTINTSAVTGTSADLIKSVGIASKAFNYNNETYITAIHQSTLQSTYFVIDSQSQIISRFNPNTSGNLISNSNIPLVSQIDSSKVIIPTQKKGRLISDDDTFFTTLGVDTTTLDYDSSNPFQNEILGPTMHIAGGVLKMYDGSKIVEHGFYLFPEDLQAGATSTSGGSISDGVYQYVAVYKWTDNKGLIHQSAPSIPLDVNLTGGTNNQQQTISIPTLRITQKENVVIDLFRTEDSGTIFYKITSSTSPVFNDPSVDSINIIDTTADTSLIDNELLYTTGGILDNIMAEPCSIVESFYDRIFTAGLEDSNKIQYSKIRFSDTPVEFNDALTIQVNSKGGPITALKAMDDKMIIFKESSLFYMSGDGPNNLGQQDSFTRPELITSDIGCININSVVLTPQGLMFKSKKGIYLLSRSMELQYIGANVEEFNALTITSAVVVPEQNQIRFTTLEGNSLVYNYFINQWASFSNHRALSAVGIGFDYYYLRSDGTLYKEDDSSFTDNGSPINIKLKTGWISLAGIQAFQRVYKILLLGTFKSPHLLRVRVAYDFNEAFVQEVVIDTSEFIDGLKYGEHSPYGSDSIYGGDGNVHQVRIDLKRQKCQSIKLEIQEMQTDFDNLGEGLSLSNIMFEVGEKRGTNKLNGDKNYGTN